MKTPQLVALSAAFIAVCSLLPSRAIAQTATIPAIPEGDLSAFSTIVATGAQATLTSNINYSSIVEDFVTITSGTIPDYNVPSLESFLKPNLDSTKKVRIDPMDVIIMELTHTDQSHLGYDLQDLVLLCIFRKP
jgi:hypothetical protein